MPWRGSSRGRRGKRLKNAVFDSLDACVAAIGGYIEHRNARNARPFRWSRGPEDLVESWKRGHRRLREIESNEKDNALARERIAVNKRLVEE